MSGSEPASARVAVLMTCHNRKAITVACLEKLKVQDHLAAQDVFLVDDGCTDGTGQAASAIMPGIQVIKADGSLFWNGGMRLAWQSAKSSAVAYDFYLWLNDDVALEPDTVAMMVQDADRAVSRGGAVIISAATTEPGSDVITYGGHIRPNPKKPLRLSMVAPQGRPVAIDTISGNIVLVSAAAEQVLGNMLPDFEHIYGDLDYGFRAKAAGIPMMLASRPGGTCAANPVTGSSLDPSMSRLMRLRRKWAEEKKVHARDWRRFVKLHSVGGPLYRFAMRAGPFLRILVDRPNQHAARIVDQA